MAPRSKQPLQCQICTEQVSKYTCAQCSIVYCSVGCYKKHKEATCISPASPTRSNLQSPQDVQELISAEVGKTSSEEVATLADPTPLRPLASLNWPYVPEESAFPDPLKKNDPKTLQLSQYEAIATSPAIRQALASHKNLPDLLTSIDRLRGPDREQALQRALGVTAPEIDDQLRPMELGEDVLALRTLAEAIEAAVRGENQSALGLNWGD
ncbi:hypothetical protein B0H34DRAFT_344813 [Crassisporium funariophilum]|nr:hypothetical protein B0H34DRAFT_344813 [Crassisporium funariophilum]